MTFDPGRFYPDGAGSSSSSSSSPAPVTPYLRKDELAGALDGLDPPGDGATQKAVRQGLASLIGRLKSVAPLLLLLALPPAAPGAVPWEDVPPSTPVDTATVGTSLDFTNDFLRAESDPTVPAWAKAAQPPAVVESDPVFAAWRDDASAEFAGTAEGAKRADYADAAGYASYAGNADYADEAGRAALAEEADRADEAERADFAENADTADTALALVDDGGSPRTYADIAAGIAAATQRVARASSSIGWATGPLALSVGAALSADLAGWPDGAAVFVRLSASGPYAVDPAVSLLGYGTWPTNSASCVAVRDGARVLVTVLEGR